MVESRYQIAAYVEHSHATLTEWSSDEGYFLYFYGSNAYYPIDINSFVKNEP